MKRIIKGILAICAFMMISSPTFASDKDVEHIYLATPEHVRWESDTVGSWSSVSKAKEYQVKLYRADFIARDEDDLQDFDWEEAEEEVVMVQRTTAKQMNFTDYMQDGYTYFFAVRAVPQLNQQAYVNAGEWVASVDVDLRNQQVIGITDGTWRYFLEGTMYELDDGTFLSGGWNFIKGYWYLFNELGYRMSGAQYIDGKSYYLNEEGILEIGWIQLGENWYYSDDDGVLQANCWIEYLPGDFYYLGEDGRMVTEE